MMVQKTKMGQEQAYMWQAAWQIFEQYFKIVAFKILHMNELRNPEDEVKAK